MLAHLKRHHLGKPWGHWPEDTKVEEGVWRDYYSGEKLDDFEKPWKKPHDKLYGESKNWVGLYTWWPKHSHVIQFNNLVGNPLFFALERLSLQK